MVCARHQNAWDVPTLSAGGLPCCSKSLMFLTKRESYALSKDECRLRIKLWAVRGFVVDVADRNARQIHTSSWEPRKLDISGVTEAQVDVLAAELTKDL